MSDDQEAGREALHPPSSHKTSASRMITRDQFVRSKNHRAGFAIAPILYMLMLVGVGAGVLFSGYSQILRSNIQITNTMTAKNDLSGAATTLAATSVLSADTTLFCPPRSSHESGGTPCTAAPEKLVQFADVAAPDQGHRPTNFAAADTTGSPVEAGVFAAGAGLKQLDPWGHFYVYCRWENARINAADPALTLITAGPDGTLDTKCGDTTQKNDDQMITLAVGAAIQRAAIWQDTGSTVEYGATGTKVEVHPDGTLKAIMLDVTGTATFHSEMTLDIPLPLTSGGTGSATAGGARANLGSGTVGDLLFTATSQSSGRSILGSTTMGDYLFSSNSLVSGTASAVRATLLGSSSVGDTIFISDAPTGRAALGSSTIGDALFVTASAGAARTTLGATAMGDYLFSSSLNDAVIAPDVRSILLGSGSIGDSVFVATTTADAQTALGGTTIGKKIFSVANQAAALSVLGLTGTARPTLNVDIDGAAGTVDASGITGVLGISQGGTGASDAGSARSNLGADDASNLTTGTLNIARIADNSIASAKLTTTGVSAGAYNWGTVDAQGRVTYAQTVVSSGLSDGAGDQIIATSTGGLGYLYFYTSSGIKMTLDSNGNLGIGTQVPGEKLHVNDGNIRISGADSTSRELQFATGTDSLRWKVVTNETPESGSNVGSDFVVKSYQDDGTALASPLTIRRSDSRATFSGVAAAPYVQLGDGLVGTPALGFINSTNMGLYRPGANTMALVTGGAEAIRLTGTQSIGLGTTTPANRLDVNGGMAVGSYAGGVAAPSNSVIISGVVGIGTSVPTTGVSLDIGSMTDSVLLPNGTTGQRPSGVEGMIRYNSTLTTIEVFQGSSWGSLLTSTSTVAANVSLGTAAGSTNPQRSGEVGTGLFSDTASTVQIATGATERLRVTATGSVGIGTTTPTQMLSVAGSVDLNGTLYQSGTNMIYQNTASFNLIVGNSNFASKNTTGAFNNAFGYESLGKNTTGTSNSAFGYQALRDHTTGTANNAFGVNAMLNTTSGSYNNGFGVYALRSTSTGSNNIGIGFTAGYANTSGTYNIVMGTSTVNNMTTGSSNIVIGNSLDLPSAGQSNYLNIGGLIYGDTSTGVVGIGTSVPNVGAALDISGKTNSLLLPTGSTGQRPTGVEGMVRYNSTLTSVEVYQNAAWGSLLTSTSTVANNVNLGSSSAATNPQKSGEVGTGLFSSVASTVQIATGATERLRVTATGSVGIGTTTPTQELSLAGDIDLSGVLYMSGTNAYWQSTTASDGNLAIGQTNFPNKNVVNGALGKNNIAIGYLALNSATQAAQSVAIGSLALQSALQGSGNTAIGYFAAAGNTGASNLTAVGWAALGATAGSSNTGIGLAAGRNLASGTNNALIGDNVLFTATANSSFNTAMGSSAMYKYGPGSNNVAMGYQALYSDLDNAGATVATGSSNVAIGYKSGANITTGSQNTFLGFNSGYKITTGSNNLVLGTSTASGVTTGSSNIIIGSGLDVPSAGQSNYLNIGGLIYGDTSTGVVGIGTSVPNSQTALDMSGKTNSMLLPTGTTGQRPGSPVAGMVRYNSTLTSAEVYQNSAWGSLLTSTSTVTSSVTIGSSAAATSPQVSGEVGTGLFSSAASTVQIATGATERLRVTATGSVGIGTTTPTQELSLTGDIDMSGVLYMSATNAHYQTVSGRNVIIGPSNFANTVSSGNFNTAVGYIALNKNTSGVANNAFGYGALTATTTGYNNNSFGSLTLSQNTTGYNNNAFGYASLGGNLTGFNNNAFGYGTLATATAVQNNAFGYAALFSVTNGIRNTAVGDAAGYGITSGSNNLVLGTSTATNLNTGSNNILVGSGLNVPSSGQSNYLNIGGLIYGDTSTGVVGIGTSVPNIGAALDMSGKTSSILLPTGTTGQRPGSPVAGMVRYNSTTTANEVYQGAAWGSILTDQSTISNTINLGSTATATSPRRSGEVGTGLYSDTASTVEIATGGSERLRITSTGSVGIANTTPQQIVDVTGNVRASALMPSSSSVPTVGVYLPATNTIGFATNSAAVMRVTATGSVGIGTTTPTQEFSLTGDMDMSGVLYMSGTNAQYQTASAQNVIIGPSNFANTISSGTSNTAVGYIALNKNTSGSVNSAFGSTALAATTTGIANSAFGAATLTANTTGIHNSAFGYGALNATTTGYNNSAFGSQALLNNTTGYNNNAVGYGSLASNQTGFNNNAFGYGTLNGANPSIQNNAFGFAALLGVTTGIRNTAVGDAAGFGITSGSNNLVLGTSTATNLNTGSNNILVGSGLNVPSSGQSNYLNIGGLIYGDTSTGVVGIGTSVPNANTALDMSGKTNSMLLPTGTTGQRPTATNGMLRYNSTTNLFEFYQNSAWVNYTTVSDARLKTNVKPVQGALGVIDKMKPVYFNWDKNNPRAVGLGDDRRHVGFLAQDLEKVLPEVVTVGGDSYRSVEYGQIVAVAVGAIKELKASNAELRAANDNLQQQVQELRSGRRTDGEGSGDDDMARVAILLSGLSLAGMVGVGWILLRTRREMEKPKRRRKAA